MDNIRIEHSTRVEVPGPLAAAIVGSIIADAIRSAGAASAKVRVTGAPRIGAPWPGQGGIYAGIQRGRDGAPDHHLIVPTKDAGRIADISWGGRGKDIEDAKSDWDGLTNTRALLASPSEHPAAQWAAGLEIDGHRDFYLPSRRELRLAWVNVPELFDDGWCWSSTQYSPDCAWIQGFAGGGQGYGGKDNSSRACAVRRLIIQ